MDDIESQLDEVDCGASTLDAKDWSILLTEKDRAFSWKVTRWNTVVQIVRDYGRQLDAADNYTMHFADLELIAPHFCENWTSANDLTKWSKFSTCV